MWQLFRSILILKDVLTELRLLCLGYQLLMELEELFESFIYKPCDSRIVDQHLVFIMSCILAVWNLQQIHNLDTQSTILYLGTDSNMSSKEGRCETSSTSLTIKRRGRLHYVLELLQSVIWVLKIDNLLVLLLNNRRQILVDITKCFLVSINLLSLVLKLLENNIRASSVLLIIVLHLWQLSFQEWVLLLQSFNLDLQVVQLILCHLMISLLLNNSSFEIRKFSFVKRLGLFYLWLSSILLTP